MLYRMLEVRAHGMQSCWCHAHAHDHGGMFWVVGRVRVGEMLGVRAVSGGALQCAVGVRCCTVQPMLEVRAHAIFRISWSMVPA